MPNTLHVLESFRLPHKEAAQNHGDNGKHAQQENETPAQSAECKINSSGQKDPQRPTALYDRIEQTAALRGHLFVDDGDGNGKFRVG